MEPGYHKPGDAPFSFPPQGVDSKIDANLVEIEGRNGTGKTTLLNCLALALGYLDQEKDLERKPTLKRKLQDLDENKTLEYHFRIHCDKHEPIDLIIERAKGQKPKCFFNSKPVTIETIDKKFEVVFLTEDDPKKVVNASLGKLSKYFNDLEKGLVSLQDTINKHLMNISEFHEFKRKEENMIKEIEHLEQSVKKKKRQLTELQEKLKKVELKEQIKRKLELLSNENKITAEYNSLKKRYDQLKDKTSADIVQKLSKERLNLRLADEELKEIDGRIIQICSSLGLYGIPIQSRKLLENDYSELNELNKKIQPQKQKEAVKMQMVEDMIALFQRYLENDIVPLIDKPVHEVLRELRGIKVRLASDRVFALINTLNSAMNERKMKIVAINKIQEKIYELSQKSKDLKEFGDVQNLFFEAEKRYLDLQVVLRENRTELLSKWNELALIEGTPENVQKVLQELEISVRTEETMITKIQESLNLLRENAAKKPKYEEKETELKVLYEKISRMRENIFQWVQILQNPVQAREQFTSLEKRAGFGLHDYERFVKAVGEYLGNQFEPVAFDYKLHEIKFFDIEKDTFTTKEDRQIPINKLSQGQSKITTLTGVFKKMDPNRKKIVLIDEIADLDPENLQTVKNNLQDEYNRGSLLLAILVRPPRESSSKMLEIRGWS
jgi:energy-coupling factor transporter ATP-binding protein EcfA2